MLENLYNMCCNSLTSKFPSKPVKAVEAGALLLSTFDRSLYSGFARESLKCAGRNVLYSNLLPAPNFPVYCRLHEEDKSLDRGNANANTNTNTNTNTSTNTSTNPDPNPNPNQNWF